MNEASVYTKRFGIFISIVLASMILITLSILLKTTIEKPYEKREYKNLAAVEITAGSVYIYDATRGEVIMERNATTPRPIASITKVMSSIVAYDIWPKDEIIEVSLPNFVPNEAGGSLVMLTEKWQLQNLLKLLLTKSSNEAADALVNHAAMKNIDFIALMNKKAKEMGLWQTRFSNASGLDLSLSEPGATSSAEDVAFMLDYAVDRYPELFETTVTKGYNAKSEAGTDYYVENTNKVADFLPGLIASKTGLTDLAGGNLAFALRMKDQSIVIVVVLGSTKEGRFADAEKITQALNMDLKEE